MVDDSVGDPAEAKLAAERLIAANKPYIIIGTYIRAFTATVAEVAKANKVVLVMDAS